MLPGTPGWGAMPVPPSDVPVPPKLLSDTMCLLISIRKSTPQQNRQLDILISNSEQQVDHFVGELTFGT